MAARTLPELRSIRAMALPQLRWRTIRSVLSGDVADDRIIRTATILAPFVLVFFAYLLAGKLGQATTNLRSSNLGPVWPAYGIALAAALRYGWRIWPALSAAAFLIAVEGSVSAAAAAGQAMGVTLGALTGSFLLHRISRFDPSLPRLRDALGLIVLGAFGSALVSSVIGVFSLYAAGIQPYSGLVSAWLVYWLGDSTGVLLITPLIFTPLVREVPSRARAFELAMLLKLLTMACLVIFGDWHAFPIELDILAFAVLPIVMWGAISFGVGGATLAVFWTATLATVLTALGHGPFAGNTPFVNAVLLDALFIVLSITGLSLAAVIAERERAEQEHARLIQEQAALEARLALSAVNRKLIEAQEQERTRIARELHDNISQRLALLISDITGRAVEDQGRAAQLQKRASEIAADVHALSHKLHSSKLDLLGLARSMRTLCEEFGRQYELRVAFEVQGVPDQLPPEMSLCLYRILQEALQNAVKHSGAPDVEVRLRAMSGEIHLQVRDRGVGFDPDTLEGHRGIGVMSMQERINLAGGHLAIDSAPGRGTTIHASVPLEAPPTIDVG